MASVRHAVLQKTINSANLATLVENVPLSLLRSGYLYWVGGNLNYRRSYGNYWSGFSYSSTGSRNLRFNSTSVYPRDGSSRGAGFALRRLVLGFSFSFHGP